MKAITHSDTPCPFCGLTCDDLLVELNREGGLTVQRACPIGEAGFTRRDNPQAATPRVGRRDATYEEAVEHATAILRGARSPLFAGLGTDVSGMRAVLELADRLGAALDHMHGDTVMRNMLAVQETGWITTTLAEVANRADMLLIVGVDLDRAFPRFGERLLNPAQALFVCPPAARRIHVLGPHDFHPPAGIPVASRMECTPDEIPAMVQGMRALLRGARLTRSPVAGIALETLSRLVHELRTARYGVVVWAAQHLDIPHADLTVQALCGLIDDLNRQTRWSGLPLGGADGATTAQQVSLWQTGYPPPLSFARGYPEHDPRRFAFRRLLAAGEADALVWISAFDGTRRPPDAAIPRIVLARPDAVVEGEVYIPVGVPGLDHSGHVFRCDNVVAMPVRAVRPAISPSVAQTLQAIAARL